MTTWTPGTLDSFDTPAILWQKLLQMGWLAAAAGTLSPPVVAQQQYLKADDGTWHLFDLVLDGGINTERVLQTATASPGAQYRGYVVLLADDATKHRLSLIYEGGIYTLSVTQSATSEAAVASIVVQSSDANPDGYAVTMVNEGGLYTLAIEQP